MQARMQAVSTWLTSSVRPVVALVAHFLGTRIGVRPTLVVVACLLVVPFVVLYRSPPRQMPKLPRPLPSRRSTRAPRCGVSAELNVVGGHLYLERDGRVLLGQRHPASAYGGGQWH